MEDIVLSSLTSPERNDTTFGFWEHNLSTDKVYLSSLGKEILGLENSDTLIDAAVLFRQLHPEDAVRVRNTLEQALRDRARYQLEYRIQFHDGSYHWIQLHGEVVCDRDGQPQCTVGSFRDITAFKTTQHTLFEQSRLLDMIFRYSLDGIVILDRDFNFVRVNETYARYCRRPACDFPGLNHFELYPSELRQEVEPHRLSKTSYSCSARPFVFPDHPEWGTTYWDLAFVPILDDKGEIEFFLFTLKDVTAGVRAEESTQEYIARLKYLSAHLVTVQESERAALARELHDEIGQNLTAVKIRLQAMLDSGLRGGNLDSSGGLEDALATTAKILDQVRGLSLDLRPMQLDDLGLEVALTALIERNAALAGWEVFPEITLFGTALDDNVELACYRVAQEALTNVMRHAAATTVWLSLQRQGDVLQLSVRDNGHGFDPMLARSRLALTHFGLFGMESRVRNLNGRFEISSAPGTGTVISASFPLNEAHEAGS